MKLFKSGSFWVSIASAIILILQAVFGWKVDNLLVNELSSALLGALVMLGFIKKPADTTDSNAEPKEDDSESANEENKDDDADEDNKNN